MCRHNSRPVYFCSTPVNRFVTHAKCTYGEDNNVAAGLIKSSSWTRSWIKGPSNDKLKLFHRKGLCQQKLDPPLSPCNTAYGNVSAPLHPPNLQAIVSVCSRVSAVHSIKTTYWTQGKRKNQQSGLCCICFAGVAAFLLKYSNFAVKEH